MDSGYLKSQRAEGVFDSEGHFTLAAGAVTKMGRFSLPEPAYWLLKIVQAAFVSGAVEFIVKQTRAGTLIAFCPDQAFDVTALRAALESLDTSPDLATSLLASGMQAVGMGQGREFSLRLIGAQSVDCLSFSEGDVSSSSSREGHGRESIQAIELRVAWSGDSRRQTIRESCLLAERVRACPMRVKLDGRVINSMALQPGSDRKTSLTYLALGASSHPSETLTPFWAPEVVYSRATRAMSDKFTDSRPVAKIVPSPGPVSLVFQLDFGYKITNWGMQKHQQFEFELCGRPSRIHWLRHGVLSQSEDIGFLSGAVSCDLYVDATHLPTDASGFILRDCFEEKKRMRKEAMKLLGPFLGEVQEQLESLWALPFKRLLAATYGFVGLHSLAFTIPMKFIHLGMLGVFAKVFSGYKRQIMDCCSRELDVFRARFANI